MECAGCRAPLVEGISFCPSCGMRVVQTASRQADPLRQQLQDAVERDYTLVRLLGRGGMGAVYLAREIALDRLVAIKVLPPGAADSADRRAKFRREAQLAAKLSHPNIVPLHSFGERDGVPYYLMGYVRGESLADRLRREGRIPHGDARLMLAQLADALEYAHAKGVIHRDIKPDNILLDDETGRPLLADFGIAQGMDPGASHVESGGVAGTLHYMSPEQAMGAASIDGRSDVYALGVVGYVMLAGRTPFTAGSYGAFVEEQAKADPPSLRTRVPDVPPDLASALMRCLERDPTRRWTDARAFKDALGAALDDDPDRLPGELREVAGSVFYSVVLGWLLGTTASALYSPVTGWLSSRFAALVFPGGWGKWVTVSFVALIIPVSFIATAALHHHKGIAWADLGRVSLWPPGWWPFPWPAAWRRPWDVWRQLPRTVRLIRILCGWVVLVVFLALPLAMRRQTLIVFLGLLGAAYAAVTALMVFTAWWASRSGIPNNADLRSLCMRSSSDRRFWRRPTMTASLLPVESETSELSPKTPAEYVRALAGVTLQLTAHARETGVRAVETARQACAALESLDGELERLTQAADLDDAAVRERQLAIDRRRGRLTELLEALWREQVRMTHEKSAAATQRFAETVTSYAQEVTACSTAEGSGDTLTMRPTSDEATGMDVTRAAAPRRTP